MVRIIFSGTYSGFSTLYDSDRNYSRRGDNDPAARHLLDRGQYLYRGNGRLYRKGYSIQPVCSEGAVGVFFHKIMLLSDFFGRGQGFMTASLFLPKDEWLDGSVIRQALDELVDNYEMLADTGKAVIEIDWSFVDRKAEELNRIETDRVWNTLPPDKPSQGPALLRGLEPGDVDIYFTYPNPLFGILPNFEQVFLTEEILSDETTGYSVILKMDADPTNPDISIPRPSDYNCNVLEWKAERMKKKTLDAELKANGGQLCWGKVSKPGYRAGEVWLTNEDLKKLDDRYEIRLSSPSLNMMEAMVTLQLMDKEQNQPISEEKIGDFTFEWSCLSVTAKPEKQGVTSFHFKGEQCENKAWTVKVSHSSFKQSVETITVSDGITPTIHIVLEPKKLIVISVSVIAPDSYKNMVQNEYVVYEDEKDRTIENIGEKFKKFEDELQVDVFDMGNGMVQVEVKERPRPTVWKILAVTEESVNSNVAETEYNGDDPIKLSEEVIRFKEKLEKELLWKVKLKENGEEDVINDIKKKQVILKVVRMPKPPIVTPPLDPISETDQSETVTTPIHPSNGTTTAPDATTTTMSDDKTEEDKPKEKPRTFYILLDYASKDFLLFKNKNSVVEDNGAKDDSVGYDGKLHCLTWKGLSSERPDPSKLRLKECGKYRFEFANSSTLQWSETSDGRNRFKVNKYPKEESQTFYIPLDDGSRDFPLFKNYKTSVQVQEAIEDLRTQSEGVKEDDSKLAQTIAERLDNGDTNYALKLTKSFSNEPQGKRLREIAKKAIHTKNHSYVVEGNDSVSYDSDNHCLTWQGLSSQRPDPNGLKLKEDTRHHYEFVKDPEHPLQWADTPGDHRYKLNKITDKIDIYSLLGWVRKHWWIFAIGVVVVGVVYVVVNWSNIKENLPRHASDPQPVAVFGEELINNMNEIVGNYSDSTKYVGDDVFEKIETIYKQCSDSIGNNQNRLENAAAKGLKTDTTGFHDFEILYKKQGDYCNYEINYKEVCEYLLKKEKWDNCDSVQWFKLQNDQDWLSTHANQLKLCGVTERQVSTEWKEHVMVATIQKTEERFSERSKPLGEEIAANDIILAMQLDSKKWKNNVGNLTKWECKNYADFLYGMKKGLEDSFNKQQYRNIITKKIIKIDTCHIKQALDSMNQLFRNESNLYGPRSSYAHFLGFLDAGEQQNYQIYTASSRTSQTPGASSSSSGTSSPSTGSSSHGGQNTQGQVNVGTDGGTGRSTNTVTDTQDQVTTIIIVKNIDELWGACNRLEHVKDYDKYIRFNCSTEYLKNNLINKIISVKKVIDENNENSYVELYNSVNDRKIKVSIKFDSLIDELKAKAQQTNN